jgi:hypothetical protein
MFRKQQEMTTTDGITKKPPSLPKTKKPNTPMNLMTMFEKQRAASTSQEQKEEVPPGVDPLHVIVSNAPVGAGHIFQRSPFAEETVSAGAAAPMQQGSQSSQTSSSVDNEYLCVVCEDAKKQVIILPCRHMVLCAKCANFDVIKECPMCRGKVEDSMNVYW